MVTRVPRALWFRGKVLGIQRLKVLEFRPFGMLTGGVGKQGQQNWLRANSAAAVTGSHLVEGAPKTNSSFAVVNDNT